MKIKLTHILLSLAALLFFGCEEDAVTDQSQIDSKIDSSAKKPGGGNGGGNGGGGNGGGNGPKVYTTGDAADVSTSTSFGIALMGGADAYTTAETAAFQFLVNKSGGGDFVVLRASGSDGYNSFIYNDIGGVNSVETIIVDSRADADHTTTETIVKNAEAIFIAGGDQSDYVNYWKDTKLEAAINYALNTKNIPIGGSSAGLAILGEFYYGATGSSVISSEALNDPYNSGMAGLDGGSFLNVNYLSNLITDSHYNERDRQGRHFTFMARLVQDFGVAYGSVKGIGVDEATAVLVESNGSSKVFGSGSAYFLKGNGGTPETCQSGTPLTWYRGGQAVSAYVVPGTTNGSNTFNLASWSGSGGTSEYWYANSGSFTRN
ncbi:Cyanophycinase [Fulvivirga imtechensis AK7]|uniref:Cyanophycinase n=1 Tax=Fulvivirga imtechensis AK7 TaxID=1237149 RepID=L8JWE1_9BACT|nr:cyanophycinase [Fulvivirga imtechensis]ELR73105.1 Cyanophycinase [Fulvivirga imtechensis AK7]